MMACNDVSDCTGIFLVYDNGDDIGSCHLLNITRPQNIFVNETPGSAPTVDPWLQFYFDGVLPDKRTSVFICCKLNSIRELSFFTGRGGICL